MNPSTPKYPPLARIWQRCIAFLMDIILVFNLSMVVLILYILPQKYPGQLGELQNSIMHYISTTQTLQPNEALPVFTLSQSQQSLIRYCQNTTLLFYWLYFMMTDIFFSGSSIGKKVFKLKIIKKKTGFPLSFVDSCLRSSIKSLTFVFAFPLLLINYILVFFTSKRQTGHDWIAGTIVVEDNFPNESNTNESESF